MQKERNRYFSIPKPINSSTRIPKVDNSSTQNDYTDMSTRQIRTNNDINTDPSHINLKRQSRLFVTEFGRR